ncbi:MAG: ABC transporter ATP-binding protein [Spirochaetia bacterium]|nr:ABC transporter ATP-binding protein [Spirochaetia bacterium]
MEPLLSCKDVWFGYQEEKPLLKAVSFQLESGCLTSILGPNGAGKSTLFSLMLGLCKPQKGIIELQTKDIRTLSRKEIAQNIAWVPQREQINFEFTVDEMVSMGSYLVQPNVQERESIMEKVGIAELRDRSVTSLSGGEYQKVMIGRALMQHPRLLLLDEPTTYLDPLQQQYLMGLLADLAAQGLCICCILHEVNIALSYSSRTLLLKEGKTLAFGPTDKVLTETNLTSLYDVRTTIENGTKTGKIYCSFTL